jgi:Family of unknown function (DUF5372)
VTVTPPFHPLAGRRLRVLGRQRSHRGLELAFDGGDLGRVRLPAAWTDRVPPEAAGRVSAGGLADLVAVMAAVSPRRAGCGPRALTARLPEAGGFLPGSR